MISLPVLCFYLIGHLIISIVSLPQSNTSLNTLLLVFFSI